MILGAIGWCPIHALYRSLRYHGNPREMTAVEQRRKRRIEQRRKRRIEQSRERGAVAGPEDL